MNIFFLDEDVFLCARYHCDPHVVKMILESAQILCTVLATHSISAPYRPTHQKHPCVIWAGKSLDNWSWLRDLTLALDEEYRYRFDHTRSHQSASVARSLTRPPIPAIGITHRPQVMPEQYRIPNHPVSAYRQFYLAEKAHLLKYTKRERPHWMLGD